VFRRILKRRLSYWRWFELTLGNRRQQCDFSVIDAVLLKPLPYRRVSDDWGYEVKSAEKGSERANCAGSGGGMEPHSRKLQ